MSFLSEVDLPHPPGDHPDWQESWVLIFRDPSTNCVGFLRAGSYVNRGTSQSHWGMALPDGTRFRRHSLDQKLEVGDRTRTSARSGAIRVSFPDLAYARFEAVDPDAEVDLRVYDWFASQEWDMIGPGSRSHDGDPSSSVAETHGHPESAGRLEGRVRIGDRVIDVEDGFGYRDHAFGPRRHQVFRSARWHAGTVGPPLSYSLVTMHAEDGSFHKMGWVVRDGTRIAVVDLQTVSQTLGDGFSVLGGWTLAELETGETLRIEAETIDGVVTSTLLPNGGPGSSPAGLEALSIARWNGYEGLCDFNMIDNAHRGEQPVSDLLFANSSDGLSKRVFDPSKAR